MNEVTGEQDPVVKLIDFANPANNQFHAINQFRVDTPGCVKQFIIIPDIVLFVNGIPLAGGGVQARWPHLCQPDARGLCADATLSQCARGDACSGVEGRRAAPVSHESVTHPHQCCGGGLRHPHLGRGTLLRLEDAVAGGR